MMIKLITITISILFLFSSISFAADELPAKIELPSKTNKSKKQNELNNAESDPCKSAKGAGQQECAHNKMVIADKELNAIYKALLAKLLEVDGVEGGETGRYPKRGLIEAQKAWIKYRDTNCAFYGDIYGGAPVWRSVEDLYCRTEMTTTRTKELRKFLDN
jgi:uncharacterized protein YecT (DUF1311 family)